MMRTYRDIVNALKELFTTLGFEFWYLYVEKYYWRDSVTTPTGKRFIDENNDEEFTLGWNTVPHIVMIVNDPMTLFIQSQNFHFERSEEDELES